MRRGERRAPILRTRAFVRLADPASAAGALRSLLASARQARAEIDHPLGTVAIETDDEGVSVSVSSADGAALRALQSLVATVLRRQAAPVSVEIVWTGGQAPPSFFRALTVTRVLDITPRMRRIVLAGEDLWRFGSGGLHVRLMLPLPGDDWSALSGPGTPCLWPPQEGVVATRAYTIRAIDPQAGSIAVDILRHDADTEDAVGARFAETARPGDRIGMTGPGGGGVPRVDRLVLLGDATALPAIARILEALPPEGRAHAVIAVAGREEEQPLASPADLTLEWLHGGPGLLDARLGDLREVVEEACAYVWAAAEFSEAQAIRRRLRADWKLSRRRHLVTAYWRRGVV